MRKNIIIAMCVCSLKITASPQVSDYLIIGKDTLPLYQLIVENYLQSIEQPTDSNSLFGFSFRNNFGYGMTSTNCWRGYQAVYSLENDSLFIKHILPCNTIRNGIDANDIINSNEQLKKIFKEKFKDNKVFIDWYSNEFTISKGKPVWWDDIFTRIYDKEELYVFRKGILVDKHIINNYQKVKGGISRNKKEMSKAVFKKIKQLNWKELNDFLCDDMYCIEIDTRGKVINVEINNRIELDKDDLHCQKVIKKQLQDLQFDIIMYRGIPFNDKFCIEVFYDEEKDKLENWSKYD